MKVKLACNVLSHSTSAGLNTMVSANQISPSALATCIYCQKLINSPSFKASVHLRRPIMMKSEKTLKFVNESIPWFKRLEMFNDCQCKFIGGMIQNLNVLMKLVGNLSSMGIPFLCTRNLNQDPLEHFFSTIRNKQKHVTAGDFQTMYSRLSVTTLMKPSRSGNCEVNEDPQVDSFIAYAPEPTERLPEHVEVCVGVLLCQSIIRTMSA